MGIVRAMETSAAVDHANAFEDPARESEYEAARARFVQPATSQANALVLLGSIGLFVAADVARGRSLRELVIFVAVLLFHELGHYVGMVGLGYRDVRMFFIPLFGAAVTGQPGRASQTREAIVLLLGPVPGIVFGFSAALAAVIFHAPLVRSIALYLLGINALNLLPIAPLDGGRLASVLLFSRWRWSEALFAGVTLVAAAVFAFGAGVPIFGGFALFLLLLVPARARMAAVAARAREHCAVNDPRALDEAATRALFVAVRAAIPKPSAKVIGEWMIQVLEMGSRRAPSLRRTLALAAAWGAAMVVAFVGLALATYAR